MPSKQDSIKEMRSHACDWTITRKYLSCINNLSRFIIEKSNVARFKSNCKHLIIWRDPATTRRHRFLALYFKLIIFKRLLLSVEQLFLLFIIVIVKLLACFDHIFTVPYLDKSFTFDRKKEWWVVVVVEAPTGLFWRLTPLTYACCSAFGGWVFILWVVLRKHPYSDVAIHASGKY